MNEIRKLMEAIEKIDEAVDMFAYDDAAAQELDKMDADTTRNYYVLYQDNSGGEGVIRDKLTKEQAEVVVKRELKKYFSEDYSTENAYTKHTKGSNVWRLIDPGNFGMRWEIMQRSDDDRFDEAYEEVLGEARSENEEIAEQLYQIKEEIKDLMDNARNLLRGTDAEDSAESYWIPHIFMALDDEHDWLGGSMHSLQDSIDELSGGDEEDDGSWEAAARANEL